MIQTILNEAEIALVDFVTAKREESNQRNGLLDRSFCRPEVRSEKARMGFGAEIAFCKIFGEYPDLEDGSFGRSDVLLRRRGTIVGVDVKSTAKETGDLIVYVRKRLDPPDAFALMFCAWPRFVFRGMAWAADVLNNARLSDLGYGPAYRFPSSALMTMPEFENDLFTARGGAIPSLPEPTLVERERVALVEAARREARAIETGGANP